jgi:hypothetical protein
MIFSDKNSICESNNKKNICFVNQLDITNKNLTNQDVNSQIINFENNSFKKENLGFHLTLKDPNNTQSNCNSISTKTNTKSQPDIGGKNEHTENSNQRSSEYWKKDYGLLHAARESK